MQKKPRCISRMLIWLLTAALCSGLLAVPAAAGEEAPSWPRDVPLDIRDDWKDPELGPALLTELEALIQDALDAAEADAPAEEVASLYDLATGKYDEFFTQFTLCYWGYFRDPEANVELYAAWNSDANYAISLITEASQSLFAGPYQDVFRKEFGDTYWELTLSQPICGEEQFALLEDEQALVNRYNLLSTELLTELTVEYGGERYSMSTLETAYSEETLSDEAYTELSFELAQLANAELGPLFLELVDVRNEFARSLGFDNYTEYAFPFTFQRDYTAEDALAFCRNAIGTLGPTVNRLYLPADPDVDLSALEDAILAADSAELAEMTRPVADAVSGQLGELFQYLTDNRLLDAEPLETKLTGGFTYDLPSYGSGYIYISPSYNIYPTMIHEFGHFARLCLASTDLTCYDVSEIHSQGLEMLGLAFADLVVGEELAPSLRQYEMFSIIRDAMLSGAVYASLEIQAYLDGDMTLDELNRLYFQLLSAADLDPYGGGVAYGWYQIPHLFQSPCYYVSYVTSAVSALELLVLSQEDYDRATEIYWDLLTQTDVFGYQAAVEQAGLTNFLAEPEALTELAAALEDYVCHEIWQVGPFSDLPEDHWARSSVLAAAASEYLTGGADGAFGPDRTLTGAELDAALDVLLEEDGKWGIAPEKAATREELIQAVYDCARVLGLDTSARADLSGFADAGEVSPEAGDAVAWAVAEGVLNGTGARTLTPHAPATRAQAATVLMRFWEELCAD